MTLPCKNVDNSRLSDDEIKRLFTTLDTDGNGKITLHELQQAQTSGKLGPVHSNVHALLNAVDTDESSTIEISEFFTFVRSQEKVIASLFHEIDSQSEDPNGHITASDLKSYLERDQNLTVTDSKVKALIAVIDTNKDGTVEFSEMLHGTLLVAGGCKEVVRIWSCCGPDHFYLSKRQQPYPASPMVTVTAGILSGDPPDVS
jgi:Ca2+-binding EF-hand superfamily protein